MLKRFYQANLLCFTFHNIQSYILLSVRICFICANQNRRKMSSNLNCTNKKPFTVFIEGNIGSGKTTFLNYFKGDKDIYTCVEPVDKWRNIRGHNLLSLMYEDASRWSLTFQTMVQKTMLEVHLETPEEPIKMMERSIHSARHVFVDNLLECGTMPPAEHAVLDSWYQFIISQLDVSGDMIVYLRTSPEVVYERIKERSRREESNIPLRYLMHLHELHENWLLNKTHATCKEKVIVIDANKPISEMNEEFIKCRKIIEKISQTKNDTKLILEQNSNDHHIMNPVSPSPGTTILDVA